MNNLERIRKAMSARQLDAVIIENEKNQYYAAGFPYTDGALIVFEDGAKLITDSRYTEAAAAQAEGVEVLEYTRSYRLDTIISEVIKAGGVKRAGIEDKSISYSRYLEYTSFLTCELVPVGDMFETLRAVKTEEEIAYLKQAQKISEKALSMTLPAIKPGVSEKDVAAELVYNMLRCGSEGNSFDPIVVTGKKTSMPHGVPGDNIIQSGDFVTIDYGSLCRGYCSDTTRTFAVGYADEEMRKVYDIVLKAQLAGIEACAAGVTGKDIDAAARQVIIDAGYGKYFGHGFGHGVGLNIHEAPNSNSLNTEPMPAGAVVSAEPGIYIPGKFGIRIEDVVVIREGGCENITSFPKELTIL